MPSVNKRRKLPPPPEGMEWWVSGTQQTMLVHHRSLCSGFCAIHNPSDTHMKEWATHWRSDRRIMERICPLHLIGHPDIDTLNFIENTQGSEAAYTASVHGCCGACGAGAEVD